VGVAALEEEQPPGAERAPVVVSSVLGHSLRSRSIGPQLVHLAYSTVGSLLSARRTVVLPRACRDCGNMPLRWPRRRWPGIHRPVRPPCRSVTPAYLPAGNPATIMRWCAEPLGVIVEGAVRFSRHGRSLDSFLSTLRGDQPPGPPAARGDPAVLDRPLAFRRAGPRSRVRIPTLHMYIYSVERGKTGHVTETFLSARH